VSPEQPDGVLVDDLPRARPRPRRWLFPVVWVVPIAAALVAGYLVYDRVHDQGPMITIEFEDGSGLQADQTEVKYRGVPVGRVMAVDLSPDHLHAIVQVRLRRSAAELATSGTLFWIVRPEVKLGNVSGLGTVITGAEIHMVPGHGAAASRFVGLETPPRTSERRGLRIVLRAGRLSSLHPGSPVFYRGVEVGSVQEPQLSAEATNVDVQILIEPQYAALVSRGSRFWDVSGIELDAGLFKGVKIKLDSLTSMLAGGVAFATPDEPHGQPVADGTAFQLYPSPRPEWLAWTPRIHIPAPPHP